MAKKVKSYEVDLDTMETMALDESIIETEEITEESPAEEETNGPETKNGIIVNSSTVRVREAPSYKSKTLGVMMRGDKVTILGKENEFYKISTRGIREAYIAKQFIEEE